MFSRAKSNTPQLGPSNIAALCGDANSSSGGSRMATASYTSKALFTGCPDAIVLLPIPEALF